VALDPLPDLRPILRAFRTLASSDLRSSDLHEVAVANGWQEDRSYLPDQLRFGVPGAELPLSAGVSEESVDWASLTLSYWDPYSPTDYPDIPSFLEARQAFDALYSAVVAEVQAQLGLPWRAGMDPGDQFAHKHSIWRFPASLLVIHEAGLDLQFGVEVNVWLARCTQKDPRPTSPLVDWLTSKGPLAREAG
jgi:hypothetical protein